MLRATIPRTKPAWQSSSSPSLQISPPSDFPFVRSFAGAKARDAGPMLPAGTISAAALLYGCTRADCVDVRNYIRVQFARIDPWEDPGQFALQLLPSLPEIFIDVPQGH